MIAAGAALLGSIIPTFFVYKTGKEERKNQYQKDMLSIQKNVYEDLLINLQYTMNQGSSKFYKFQESVLRVSLHGDNITAQKVEEYYAKLISGNQLTGEDHTNFHLSILNAMRMNIGLKELHSFKIIKALKY